MKKRILIVDDDTALLKNFREILESEEYEVDTAQTGKEAIDRTGQQLYNLSLIDIRLPDMEGTRLLTAMKETTPRMIKIIITGFPALENAIEAVNRGADGYIVKPLLDIDGFLKTVKEHLKKQEKAAKYDEEKVGEFIETRVKKLEGTRASTRRARKNA